MKDSMKGTGAPIHALLIGVDRYVPPRDGGVDGHYPNLRGAVRDARLVEAWLREERGVLPQRIESLLAPVEGSEPCATPPTYENMVAALKRLRTRARRGEHVWIHYSGHGGRVPTLYPELKLGDVDEALVPTDVGEPGARYLRDLELAYLFHELVEAGLRLTVVLDCCHSGGLFRKQDETAKRRRRGTEHVDRTLRPRESLVASPAELRRAWREARKVDRSDSETSSSWSFEPRGYVLLAACRAHEQAYEEVYDSHAGGILTHWLLDSARALPRRITHLELYDRVRAQVHRRQVGQTPLLAGEGPRFVLAPGRGRSDSGVTVLDVDAAAGKVLLGTGEAQGAREGSRWAVHAAGRRNEAQVACVELAELGAVSSWAVVTAGELDAIEPGATAVRLSAPRRPDRVRTVRLRPDLSTEPRALEELRRDIVGDELLEVLVDSDAGDVPADFQAAATHRGFELLDRQGRRLDGIEPVGLGRSRFAAWNLVHLARFHDVLELGNGDEASPLHAGLELSLHRLSGPPPDPVKPRHLAPLSGRRVTGGGLGLGDWVCLELQNVSYQVLNVTLLGLRHERWEIVRAFPERGRFQPLESREKVLLPFQVEEPGRLTVKAFGTLEGCGFDNLRLPAIGCSSARRYRPLRFASMQWTTRDLTIEPA